MPLFLSALLVKAVGEGNLSQEDALKNSALSSIQLALDRWRCSMQARRNRSGIFFEF